MEKHIKKVTALVVLHILNHMCMHSSWIPHFPTYNSMADATFKGILGRDACANVSRNRGRFGPRGSCQ
eukprot:6326283-Amphidinium_carterae.2